MSVNGVTNNVSSNYSNYSNYSAAAENTTAEKTESKEKAAESAGAVYEASEEAKSSASTKKTYTPDANLVAKLKADAEQRTQQLQSIVEQLLTKQGRTYNTANGLKSIYESLNVDPATRAQAQKDIAEDGYWGVNQTSDRIFDFAMALCGGDPDKMEEMKDAFLKGYKKAERQWGDKLPEICQNTYDAVLKKFEDYQNQNKVTE